MAGEGWWGLARVLLAAWLDGALVGFAQMLLAALIAAVLTHFLTHRRFIRGRWWDLKAEAYGKVIGALVDMEYSLRFWIYTGQLIVDLEASGGPIDYVDSELERLDEIRDKHDDAKERIRRAAVEGDYVISRKAAGKLWKLLEKYPEPPPEGFPKAEEVPDMKALLDFLRARSDEVKSCLNVVRSEAKSDLGVKWHSLF